MSERTNAIVKQHNDYCGVSKWHSKGYTGDNKLQSYDRASWGCLDIKFITYNSLKEEITMEINKENIYIKNAKAIRDICYRDDCDITVGRAKWEHEAGITWAKDEQAERNEMIKEFNKACAKYTLDKIAGNV